MELVIFSSLKNAIKDEISLCEKMVTKVVYHLLGETAWSTVVRNGTRQIPNKISTGMRSFHRHDFFPEGRIEGDPSQKAWNW